MMLSPFNRRNSELFAEIIGKARLGIISELVGYKRNRKIRARQKRQRIIHFLLGNIGFQRLSHIFSKFTA